MERKTYVLRRGIWEEIHFEHLHKGELFKLYESNGEEVRDQNGNTIFLTVSEPYLNEQGVWRIDYE